MDEKIKELLFKVKKENKYENVLWDYITNLQKENEELKENLLNEQREYEGLHKILNQKEEQFEKENYDNIVEIHRLKSRNEKAVASIHKAMLDTDITGNGTLNLNDLLNILQGDKNV